MLRNVFTRKRAADDEEDRALAWYFAAVIAALAALGWALAKVAPPAPPRQVIMTTGPEDGAYHRFAKRYRERLARDGLKLVLRPSSGAAQNLERLRSGEGGVEVGLVQGGLVRETDRETLVTLGSLFYEPIWVFYRSKSTIDHIADLNGRRVAIGVTGSGTYELGLAVARDNGLTEGETTLVEIGGLEAADALVDGRIDAVWYVLAIDAPPVQKLMRTPSVRMMDASRADAYIRRLPYLNKLDLPEGVVDLKGDIPSRQMTMIAVTGNLVARQNVHPVVVELLLQAAREVHGGPSLLHRAGLFPAPMDFELPLDSDAERFYKERPSLLRRVLPFWAAVWAERLLFILLPLVAIAIPAFAYLPKVYDWRIRRKLDGWYVEMHRIERAAAKGNSDLAAHLEALKAIEAQLNGLKVPRAYLSQLYTLRFRADFVRNLLETRLGNRAAA